MTEAIRRRLEVSGVVQGVGFRPFLYAVATDLGLAGFVRNGGTHVHVEIEGPAPLLERFEQRLRDEPPPLARVESARTCAPGGSWR